MIGLTVYPYTGFPVVYADSKPLKIVLMDLVKVLIEKDEIFHILLGNRSLKDRVGASWLPELTSHSINDAWIASQFQIHAAASTPPDVSFDFTSKILRAGGIIVGTLQVVIQGPRLPTTKLTNTATMLDVFNSAGAVTFTDQIKTFSRSMTSDGEMEILWRTLVLNHDHSGLSPEYPAPNEFGSMFEATYCQGSRSGNAGAGEEERKKKNLRICFSFSSKYRKLCNGPMPVHHCRRQNGNRAAVCQIWRFGSDAVHGELVKEADTQNSRLFELV